MVLRTLSIVLVLAGCSTKYQEMGFSGGVSAQQMIADTFRIVARGNGHTDTTTIRDYAMLSAAETTKKSGGTHFILIGGEDASRVGQIDMPGSSRTTFSGNTASTTYSPAESIPVFKPGQDIYIRVLTLKPGEIAPEGAIAAEEIIHFVGKRVDRG